MTRPFTPEEAKGLNAMIGGLSREPDQSFSGWEPKKLWRGGDGAMEECAFTEGFDSRADGRSLLAIDLDGDGDLELVMTNRAAPRIQLFRNDGPTGNAIEIDLTDAAEGAVLKVDGASHPVTLARGFASSVPPRVHVGLGAKTSAQVELVGRGAKSLGTLKAGAKYVVRDDAVKAIPFAKQSGPVPLRFPSTLEALGVPASDKPTLVTLFLENCKPCAEEAPALNAMHMAGKVRVLGLGVHPEGEPLKRAAKSVGLTVPVQQLPEWAADALSTNGQLSFPLNLLYGPDGKLQRVVYGNAGLASVR